VTPVSSATTIQENGPDVRIAGWAGARSASATGGAYRVSSTNGDTASWTLTGTSAGVVFLAGPNRGRATVAIDGTVRETVDLYRASSASLTRTYSNLANRSHTVLVRVLGTKSSSSSGVGVALDGFRAGTTAVDEAAAKVNLSGWRAVSNSSASGGSLRLQRSAGASVVLTFTGSSVDWIGARGPAYGRAKVLLDGTAIATVDSYAAGQTWRWLALRLAVPRGAHTLTVQALGTRATGASAADVPVDAFVVRP
jgi:hypothetical protein